MKPRPARIAPILIAFLLCFLGSTVRAEDGMKPARPKIGLALAGGAALGLAHVGVLLWFDEHHIPIDEIAGTSMGGLIGGAYASGMSPEEIRKLLSEVNWTETLSAAPPYQSLTFRRREDAYDFPNGLQFGWKGGIALPSGVNPGQPIGLIFSRICLPYPALKSFDELPTPFTCVATDLTKGDSRALTSGSLETALRATMAIPGYFTPVSRDGALLADGGLLNNLPTKQVKTMGADIVVAVDLQQPLLEKSALTSLIDVLGQSAAITIMSNQRQSLQQADLIVSPDLGNLGLFDFVQVDAFIKHGYDAAQSKAAVLEKLAVSDDEWREYLAQRASRRRAAALRPAFIQIGGVSGGEAKRLTERFQSFVGKPLDTAAFEAALTDATGSGMYDSLSYERVSRDGGDGLLVQVVRKGNGPPFVNLGVEINGAERDNIQTTFAGRLTTMAAGGDEVRTDLRLGTDTSIASEYYHSFARGRFFVAPRVYAQDLNQNLYIGGSNLTLAKRRSGGVGIDLGYKPNRNSELRFGLDASRFDEDIRGVPSSVGRFHGYVVDPSLRYTYDGLNGALSPSSGVRVDATVHSYLKAPGSHQPFQTADIRVERFIPWGSGSIFAVGQGGTAFGAAVPIPQKYMLGGPLSLGAYGQNEFQGNEYYLLTSGYLYRLLDLPPPLSTRILIGSWYEYGGIADTGSGSIRRQDLSLGSLLETPLGPVVVGYSIGELGRRNLYFAVGTLF
ncbi:patatin [Capsulimonas corticalis]|uniref:Patatin n=1 Tax=Capsulimonas corticalis TaxID=2219043 RepID=A0A402D2M5_9BACT|nr:patatin-like phospholipase family protein [Capsulimonas corticalis]BDI29955.1 patatin [Capsulimonas corticalis]